MGFKDKLGEIAQDATSNAAGGVVAVVTEGAGFGPMVAVGAGTLASILPPIIRAGADWIVTQRLSGAAAGMQIYAEQEEYEVDTSVFDAPPAAECFFAMFNTLINAVDDSAAGPLGHMTMQYVHQGRKPDRFFRAFGGAVKSLDASHLDALETLLAECVARMASGASYYGTGEMVTTLEDAKVIYAGLRQRPWATLVTTEDASHLLEVMRLNGLAQDGNMNTEGVAILIQKEAAERALLHLRSGRQAQTADSPDP